MAPKNGQMVMQGGLVRGCQATKWRAVVHALTHLLPGWPQVDCLAARTPVVNQVRTLHDSIPMRYRLQTEAAASIGPATAVSPVCFSPPCDGSAPAPAPEPIPAEALHPPRLKRERLPKVVQQWAACPRLQLYLWW